MVDSTTYSFIKFPEHLKGDDSVSLANKGIQCVTPSCIEGTYSKETIFNIG